MGPILLTIYACKLQLYQGKLLVRTVHSSALAYFDTAASYNNEMFTTLAPEVNFIHI